MTSCVPALSVVAHSCHFRVSEQFSRHSWQDILPCLWPIFREMQWVAQVMLHASVERAGVL